MSAYFEAEQKKPEFSKVADLAGNIVYLLPGCADLMVRKTIQQVFREFCRKTCCFKTHRRLPVKAGRNVLTAAPILCSMTEAVCDVILDGHKLTAGSDYVVIDGNPPSVILNVPANGDRPVENIVMRPEFEGKPPQPIMVDIVCAEMPSIGEETAPVWFIDKYGEAICAGVISRLCAISGKTWTNEGLSNQYAIVYNNFLNEASAKSFGDDGSQFGSGHVSTLDMSGVL